MSVTAFPNRAITKRVVVKLKNGKLNGEIHSLKSLDSESQSAALPAMLFESFKFGSKDVPSMIKKINKTIKNAPRLINQLLNRLGLPFFGLFVIRHIPPSNSQSEYE